MNRSIEGARIGTLLLSALLATGAAVAATADNKHVAFQSLQADAAGEVEVYVRLDEPAVSELNIQRYEQTGQFASRSEQLAQAARVSEQHAQWRSTIASRGGQVLSEMRVGANSLRVRVPLAEVSSLRKLPGVLSVTRVQLYKMDNITSVPWIGAPAVWTATDQGKGIKIGVIDSGIDYTHADFGGSGNPADYANNDPNVVEPGTFPTAKVAGGIDLAGHTYNAASSNPADHIAHPDADPIDGVGNATDGHGHGTHVSGTIAGIGVPGSVGPGVAPGATLYAIKVFGDLGGSTSLAGDGIEWAMDPNGDGDMSDHLDVINLSLGSSFGDPQESEAIAANNAAALGITVVIAAGNAGDVPYVLGSPGTAGGAITVAANYPGGRAYTTLKVNTPASLAGNKPAVEGSGGAVTLAQSGPVTDSLVVAVPANGCAPLTNASAVAGHVALIIRGTCSFIVKHQMAQAAGAKAVVVYNSGPAAGGEDPLTMVLDNTVVVPSVMTSYSAGAALATATGVNVTLGNFADPTKDDQIVSFSSRGPALGGSRFKPDLAAPGVNIVSAGAGSGTGSQNISGTSMATPHVSGAAALLRKLHPELDPPAIKALLQNSTVDSNASGPTELTRQGVGAIRVDKAAALTSYASPGGVSFGRLNPLFPELRTETVKLKNLASKTRVYTAKHVANRTFPGVSVECPRTVAVGVRGTAKFDVLLKFDPRAAKDLGDDAFQSQREVDGWCVLSDGKDSLRVGYIAVVDPASSVIPLPNDRLTGVKLLNLGPSSGTAEAFTLAKLNGEGEQGTESAISAVGFRRGDLNVYGGDVVEFGIALDKNIERPGGSFEIDLAVDTNNDGVTDFLLIGLDLSFVNPNIPLGTFGTLQINPQGQLWTDWLALWDYNDRSLILPFTLDTYGIDGLDLPDSFSYTMTVYGRDGSTDVQHGKVDLAKAVTPDVNSVSIDPGKSVDVSMSGNSGFTLWLLQNNILPAQTAVSYTTLPKTKDK
jgi:minor extracellular serine protease Vpr